jgi:hypothetical protein
VVFGAETAATVAHVVEAVSYVIGNNVSIINIEYFSLYKGIFVEIYVRHTTAWDTAFLHLGAALRQRSGHSGGGEKGGEKGLEEHIVRLVQSLV